MWIDPYGLCAVNKAWSWWSDVAVTTGDYWSDKTKGGWNWWNSTVTVNFNPFLEVTGKIGRGVKLAIVEGRLGASYAVSKTVHELYYNKNLHSGIKFGLIATVRTTLDVTVITSQDAFLAGLGSKVKLPFGVVQVYNVTNSMATFRETAWNLSADLQLIQIMTFSE